MQRPFSTQVFSFFRSTSCLIFILVAVVSMGGKLYSQDTLNVFFASNSAFIDQDEQARLDNWLDNLIVQNQDSFAIYGYTDDRGTAEYNQKLALDRAIAVRTFLVNDGIPYRSITRVTGKGEGVPLASNETEMGRSINRRVSILHFPYDMKMAIREQISRGLDGKQALEVLAQKKKEEAGKAKEEASNPLEVIDLNVKTDVVDCQQPARTLKADHGVEIVLGPCCLDRVSPDLSVKVLPYFSRQDMLIDDVPTMDVDGDCLETDGIVIVQILNSYGKAVELGDSCLTLRMPASSLDERKRIYFAVYGNDSTGFAWQSTYQPPLFEQGGGERGYYEVKLDVSRAVAIQKMVPNSRRHRSDPKIWVDVRPYTQDNARVYLSVDQVVLAGVWRERNACYFRRGCMPEGEAYVTVIAEEKDGSYSVAHKALNTVRFKGSREKGKYLIRKEDFVQVGSRQDLTKVLNF